MNETENTEQCTEHGDRVFEAMRDDDKNTCSKEELFNLFKHKYKIHDETSVSNENGYVLSLAKDESFTNIAAGLSDGSVRVFEVNSELGVYIEPPVGSLTNTCGLSFVDETSNLLLVGTSNGLVRLLDLRTRGEVTRFVYERSDRSEPSDISCFDINSNRRLLAVGTEEKQENVYILLYDFRKCNEVFRYEDSHQSDLASLRFHPQNPDLLCSGSTDGLINIFDVQQNDESDAILTTINTESAVSKLNWHKDSHGKDFVSCITPTNSFKAYEFDGDVIADYDRTKITESIKRSNVSKCSLINCHSMADNSIFLLACTNCSNGAILRSCKFENNQLVPYANFKGNHQLVRESIFDSKTNILITAGESGIVTLWTPLQWEIDTFSLKMKTKNSNKCKPY